MNLTIAQVLQSAIKEHKAGNLGRAEHLYCAILNAQPKHPHANHNLGVLYFDKDEYDKALPFFETAFESDPTTEQFLVSFVDTLVMLGEAKRSITYITNYQAHSDLKNLSAEFLASIKSIAREPEQPLGYINLSKAFASRRKNKNAITLLKKAINLNTRSTEAPLRLATLYLKLQKWSDAERTYQDVLKENPDCEEAHFNLGNLFSTTGRSEAAIAHYTKVIQLNPRHADAYNNLGNSFKNEGMLAKAILAYLESLKISKNDSVYQNLSLALTGVRLTEAAPGLSECIEEILSNKSLVRPRDIAQAAVSVIKCDPKYLEIAKFEDSRPDPKDTEAIVRKLGRIRLLNKLMKSCPIPDLEVEHLFSEIRRNALNRISHGDQFKISTPFYTALAIQCFLNDFVYFETPEERSLIQSLEEDIIQQIEKGIQPDATKLICLASYRRLIEYSWIGEISETVDIEELLRVQVHEPQIEHKIKLDLVRHHSSKNVISDKVRKQYEEYPYPRWIGLGIPQNPKSVKKTIEDIGLRIQDTTVLDKPSLEILIAGCGTGQQSIGTATRFPTGHVTSIDLSASSLAYAQRKTTEFNVSNVTYQQCDILNVSKLEKKFDLIECVGVLHHMQHPQNGLLELTKCLNPGGLIKLGLYSEIARKKISQYRQSIVDFEPSDTQLRFHRNNFINENNPYFSEFSTWTDFYSLNEFKDLLFNVQEHNFTIKGIQSLLALVDLEFCGFELRILPSILRKATKLDIFELKSWANFELKNPKTFRGMYQFWCQKL